MLFHCGEERAVPWPGMRRSVSDDVDSSANRCEHIRGIVWVNEDGFPGTVRFVHGGAEGALGERGAARSGGKELYAVDASLEELPSSGGRLRGVGDFGSRQFHHAHHSENLVRG